MLLATLRLHTSSAQNTASVILLITTGTYTVFQEGRQHTRGRNSVNSLPIFKILSLADSLVNVQLLKIPPHLIRVSTLPCET